MSARGSRVMAVLFVVVVAIVGFTYLGGGRANEEAAGPSATSGGDRAGPALAGKQAEIDVVAARPGREAAPAKNKEARSDASLASCITGRVSERSGTPIPGALCLLRPGVPSGGFAVSPPTDEQADRDSAISLEDGTFRLEAGPGSWRVVVQSLGLARWERDHVVAGDHVDVVLDPEVTVVFSVIDAGRDPVAGATVTILESPRDPWERALWSAETDPGGRATATGLAPGSWFLTVRHAEYAVEGRPLAIPAGRFFMEEEVRLLRGVRVAGSITTETLEPISGATVLIEVPYRGFVLKGNAIADKDGRYESPPLFSNDETLEMLAHAEGYAESSMLVGISPEEVVDGSATADFILPSLGRTLRGHAVDESGVDIGNASIRAAVIDPVGNGNDVLQSLQVASREPWLWQEYGRTDGSGRFELARLSASPQYLLMILLEPFAPRVVWVPPGEPGSVTDLGDLVMARSGSLFGWARHEDGTPGAGSTLLLYKVHRVHGLDEAASWRPDTWVHSRDALVGQDGFFRFDLLAPGDYAFASIEAGEWTVEPDQATGPVEVLLPPERPTEEQIRITGMVRDPAGQPIPLVFVTAFARDATGEQLLTNLLVQSPGSFSLRVPEGVGLSLRFTDLHGGHHDRVLSLDAPIGAQPLDVVLDDRLDPLPPIEGIVLGPRGEVVENARVSLRPPVDSLCGCIAFHRTTDGEGAFRFSVSEGPHRLDVSDPRFASAAHYPAHPGDYVTIVLAEP